MREAAFKRIYADIRGKITSAQLRAGDRLATESELAVAYGVSEPTVRHAHQLLVDEGLIVKQQGRGTFVAQLPPGMQRVLLVCGIAIDPSMGPSVYYSHTIQRCREQLAAEDVSMDVVWIDNGDVGTATAYADPRRLHDYSGYVFLGCADHHPLLQAVRGQDVNWVLLGRLSGVDHAIWRDVHSGMRLALESLLATRPATDAPVVAVALEGSQAEAAQAVAAASGVPLRLIRIPYGESLLEHEVAAYRAVKTALAGPGPHRVLFADDILARGGTRAILELRTAVDMTVEVAVLLNILATVPYGMPVHYVVHDSTAEADDAVASLVGQIHGAAPVTACHQYFLLGRSADMTPLQARDAITALPTPAAPVVP